MIRFLSLIARRDDISVADFHDHWRHPHGTMGRRIGGLRDYVQAHRTATDAFEPDATTIEGVAISRFDTVEDALGLLTDPVYVEHVQPDEPSFQDLSKNVFFCTSETVLDSRPAPSMRQSTADAWWSDLDLPVSVQLLQFYRDTGDVPSDVTAERDRGRRLGAFRHALNHPLEQWHHGDDPFAGARQLWWPTQTAFELAVAREPELFAALLGDRERTLTLLTRSERWLR